MGVITRGNKLWLRFKDATGTWITIRSGLVKGQELEAAALLADAEAEADRARGVTPKVLAPGCETVRAYAEPWIDDRRALDLDWKNDESRLRTHVLPRIGDMKLREVKTRHVIEMFRLIRTTKLEATGELPSQRLVYNIYSVVSAMFRDAKLADKIDQTPCVLDERQLGPLKDKDPEWRNGAVFTREEATELISNPAIPADRHIGYALELLAGLRPGEAAALRWRHWERDLKPLGKLLVAKGYNTRKHREKGTKTDVTKHVPVHPTLAAMLAEWRLNGWEAMFGRKPEPDDLIVPLPPSAAARRRSREGEPFRGHDYSGKRWREEDEPALGWRHRRHYDTRATFISLAVEDGADPDVLESRVTHTKKSRRAFDGYVRGEQWAKTCAEVAKLQLARKQLQGAIAMPVAAGGELEKPSARHTLVTVSANKQDDSEKSWRRRESKTGAKCRINLGSYPNFSLSCPQSCPRIVAWVEFAPIDEISVPPPRFPSLSRSCADTTTGPWKSIFIPATALFGRSGRFGRRARDGARRSDRGSPHLSVTSILSSRPSNAGRIALVERISSRRSRPYIVAKRWSPGNSASARNCAAPAAASRRCQHVTRRGLTDLLSDTPEQHDRRTNTNPGAVRSPGSTRCRSMVLQLSTRSTSSSSMSRSVPTRPMPIHAVFVLPTRTSP